MKDWRTRDWKWIIGILISIIVLTLSGWLYRIPDAMNYFSFMGSVLSIVLSLIAIYISLSQNNNSEVLNSKTIDILARIEEKVMNVNEKVNKIDPTQLASITETRVNAALSQFSNEIINKLENLDIDREKIDAIRKEVPQIKLEMKNPIPRVINIDNSNSYESLVKKEVKSILIEIKNKTFTESLSTINTTLLTNESREALYWSLVNEPYRKEKDGNDGVYEALEIMYLDKDYSKYFN